MKSKLILFASFCLLAMVGCKSSKEESYAVSQEEMAQIYETIKTPYKYGLVVAPADGGHMMDSPTVFQCEGKWYMAYLIYDELGYETCLATSDDLLHWRTLGKILKRHDEGWDKAQRGGYPALVDINWGGGYKIEKFDERYWMTYLGGAKSGYESRPLSIGVASTPTLGDSLEWQSEDIAVLSPADSDAQWFEKNTQFKSAVFRDSLRHFGHDFVMFYNASGKNEANGIVAERIGIAYSDDMLHWIRYEGNPVVAHEDTNTISGDAHIQKIGDLYVMFYFRAFDPSRTYQAYNTFACSRDLVHWYDWQGADLIYPTEPYDELYAHKSFVVNHRGVTYHYYCAVNQKGQRGIAVATSDSLGISNIAFPAIAE